MPAHALKTCPYSHCAPSTHDRFDSYAQKVHEHQPDFIAVHCQEMGGKDYKTGLPHVDAYLAFVLDGVRSMDAHAMPHPGLLIPNIPIRKIRMQIFSPAFLFQIDDKINFHFGVHTNFVTYMHVGLTAGAGRSLDTRRCGRLTASSRSSTRTGTWNTSSPCVLSRT